MGAYQLETFDASTRPRGGLAEIQSDILEKEKNEAYARGFKDGVSVTRDAIETEKNRLFSAVAERANDLQIIHSEASHAVLASAAPLVDAILRTVAPHLARSNFQKVILEHVEAACRKASDGQMTVVVAPGQAALAEDLSAREEARIAVIEDASLGPYQANIHWDGGVDKIDVIRMVDDVGAALDAFLSGIGVSEEEKNDVG